MNAIEYQKLMAERFIDNSYEGNRINKIIKEFEELTNTKFDYENLINNIEVLIDILKNEIEEHQNDIQNYEDNYKQVSTEEQIDWNERW
jgi:lysozyme family protein